LDSERERWKEGMLEGGGRESCEIEKDSKRRRRCRTNTDK